MALTTSPLHDTSLPDVVIKQTDLEHPADIDVFDGPKSVHAITIDNTANGSEANYAKFYNNTSATPGTDVPDLKIRLAQGTSRTIHIADGVSFSTAFSMFATSVTADDGTQTAPGSSIVCIVVGS
tara:strand:- start:17 stop:391 length:375 start_codon:yes stop_codon:yes gene_type:complete